MKEEILFGITPVLSCLQAKKRSCLSLYVKARGGGTTLQEIVTLCHQAKIQVQEVDTGKLDKLTGGQNHQGVALQCGRLPTIDINQLLHQTSQQSHSVIVALDQIQDPQNVGAIIRTCAYFGVDGIVTLQRNAAPLSPIVSKSSAGAMEFFPIVAANNLVQTLQRFQQESYFVFGTSLEGAVDYRTLPVPDRLVLILGNEGTGLRSLVKKNCDELIMIRNRGKIDSLNVNAAASILINHYTH